MTQHHFPHCFPHGFPMVSGHFHDALLHGLPPFGAAAVSVGISSASRLQRWWRVVHDC